MYEADCDYYQVTGVKSKACRAIPMISFSWFQIIYHYKLCCGDTGAISNDWSLQSNHKDTSVVLVHVVLDEFR